MIPSDVLEILNGLLDRSRKKEVEWLESQVARYGGFGDFMVVFPNSSLVIWENLNDGELGGRIFNNRGDVVVSFDTTSGDADSHQLLSELMDLARRKVLRADETFAEIQKAIVSNPRVGDVPKRAQVVDDDEEVPF